MTPKVQATREKKKDKLDLLRIKTAFQEGERQPTEWERMFANHRSDKGFVLRVYKELLCSTIRQIAQLKISK